MGGKWGYIDKSGRVVIEPQFTRYGGGHAGWWEFTEGLAAVRIEGKWGYIDKSEQAVIEPQFDYAGPFRDGVARVEVAGKWGYIDKTGKYIWEPSE